MVLHARKQIRDAVKVVLQNLPTTQDRVFIGRTNPFGENAPPDLLIYTPKETASRAVYGQPPILQRPLTLYVEGRAGGAAAVDDLLDQIAAEVEGKLAEPVSLDALVLDLQLVGTEIQTQAAGSSQVGGVRLEYRLTYRTPEGVPGSIV